eukprot:11899004-Alexandrium_andersonii.AAC.1
MPEARSDTRAVSEPVWGGLCAWPPGVRRYSPTEPGGPKAVGAEVGVEVIGGELPDGHAPAEAALVRFCFGASGPSPGGGSG